MLDADASLHSNGTAHGEATRHDACARGEAEALQAWLAAATVRTVVLQPPVTTVRVPSPDGVRPTGIPAPYCVPWPG